MDSESDADKRQGTRVYKKSSPNGKIFAYLSKRDFFDHLTTVDPIEGVILLDESYVKNRRVFVHVLAAFRYGREDLDVLGLTFRKDLFLAAVQLYPQKNESLHQNPIPSMVLASDEIDKKHKTAITSFDENFEQNGTSNNNKKTKPLTHLQERLMKKLGPSAYPFYFELPHHAPASVTLQPGPGDSGKPCGVDYELLAYVAEENDEKPISGRPVGCLSILRNRLAVHSHWHTNPRSSVRMAIRKLTYAPEEPAPQPCAEIVKDFMMSPGTLRLEATLDKEKYYHGEYIAVNVLVDNSSNKTVKKIKVLVIQVADIMLFSRAVYKCTVDEAEFDEGFPILPSQTGWCKVYHMCPLFSKNRDKRGLVLDGKLKNEDTNLASSTIIKDPSQKENFGIIVQYKIRVRLVLGFGVGDVSLDLPFTLSHPEPVSEASCIGDVSDLTSQPDAPVNASTDAPLRDACTTDDLITIGPPCNTQVGVKNKETPEKVSQDDLIFEDFARLRVRKDINTKVE